MKKHLIMKKHLLIILLFFISTEINAQTKLYVHEDADDYVKKTNTIAILPMQVTVKLRAKELKDFTVEQREQMNKDEALGIQRAMYSWFLTRKKRGTMLVDNIQSPDQTNAILKKNGIDIHSYNDKLPNELGEILNADVIITGSFETSKPMSVGASIGLAILGAWGPTQSATMNMNFTNTSDNELIVNYYKNIKGGLGSSAEDLINVLMRKVSRRIPYTGAE